MSRRIDIELTSQRDDESWTWRAVGAREPKGIIATSLLPNGAKVGDELRVEAEFFVDGSEITMVLPAKGARKEPETLEVLGSGRDHAGVTTSLVGKGGRGRGDREGGPRGRGGRDGGPRDRGRGDRDGRGGPNRERGDSGGGRGGPNRERGDSGGGRGGQGRGGDGARRERGDRPTRETRPAPPAKPKPKRLRARRTHRDAAMASLPAEQRPIAEQVLRGGIPGVRKAVEDQNVRNKAEGRPEIAPTPLLQLAETLLPALKEAEWHDRADAALAGMADLDLRDLRSVVVAAESNARSDETRQLAEQLRTAVSDRVDHEHNTWLSEIAGALDDDRTVRALRMSSRPPKAGAPLPPDLSARLIEAANAALSDDTGPQRWGTVLDAVAYSPIRTAVTPAGIPARPNDELLETVKRLSTRVPEIAALFGVEPQKPPRKRRKPRAGGKAGVPKPPAPPKQKADKPEARAAEPDAVVEEAAAVAEAPAVVAEPDAVVEEAAAEADPTPEPVVDGPAAEEAVVDVESTGDDA